MPRNRQDVDREEKVSAIVAVAARQLKQGGVAALSVAGIARELGLAHNAIRWYFPTRDELLVAAMRHLVGHLVARKPTASKDPRQKAVWFADQLYRHAALRAAVYERARSSEVVADFMREFQEALRGLVALLLTGDRSRRSVAIDAFLAALEGALLIDDAEQRAAVVTCAFDAFAPEAAKTGS